MRIGIGYDAHRFKKDRRLVIGGVDIPFELGLAGHSDADVLIHSICDALLGAAGFADIGHHFPDTDEKYKNISSLILLEMVGNLLTNADYTIENIDSIIVAQKPRLFKYFEMMKKNISRTLNLDENKINIKATTTERMGFEGRLEGMSSQSVALILKKKQNILI
jgi:2-C-methyl-D-erythritol 2,4-cyclodiphosphate synthase